VGGPHGKYCNASSTRFLFEHGNIVPYRSLNMYQSDNFNLSEQQVQNLAMMLDPQNGAANMAFKRPESQSIGYSLSEAQPRSSENNTTVENNVGALSHPGSVYVPPSVGQNNPHLPVVSGSKAAQRKTEQEVARKKPKGNAIWADDEVDGAYGSALGDADVVAKSDTRETPEYEVLYSTKQTAEDTFLGADFTKDASAAMSDAIVVRVKLPKLESSKELELDVVPFAMHLKTKGYKLRVDLPTKVVEKKGAAKWDAAQKVLTVTLTADPANRQVKMI
jgi:uncharacterized protein YfcZ (UPF0381/DUF406 family)